MKLHEGVSHLMTQRDGEGDVVSSIPWTRRGNVCDVHLCMCRAIVHYHTVTQYTIIHHTVCAIEALTHQPNVLLPQVEGVRVGRILYHE